jgi:hypothetical protein
MDVQSFQSIVRDAIKIRYGYLPSDVMQAPGRRIVNDQISTAKRSRSRAAARVELLVLSPRL